MLAASIAAAIGAIATLLLPYAKNIMDKRSVSLSDQRNIPENAIAAMKRAALIGVASAAAVIIAGLSLLALFPIGNSPASPAANNGDPKNVTSAAVKFASVINLTENPDDSVYGQVGAAGDSLHMVWQESVQETNYDIFVKSSRDRGGSFEDNIVNLSNNVGFSEHPQLAVSGDNNTYITWADDSSGKREILFAKSTDGISYGDPITLSDSDDSYNVEIAAFGDGVYLVWQDDEAIMFRASLDGGETFDTPVVIANNADQNSYPKMAAYNDAVHIVWSVSEEPALFYVKSPDGGSTFSDAVPLDAGMDVGEAQVAAYKDDVHVVWGGLPGAEIDELLYARSADGGDTFARPVPIGIQDPLNVELAVMPLDNDEEQYAVHIASQVVLSPQNHEIVVASSMDGGRTFADATNLSNNLGISECPTVSVSGSDIFFAWEDMTTGNHEILYAKGSL
jgi:hypothetical protein